MRERPALALLTLGQSIPMVSFLPEAKQLRADLRLLSEQSLLQVRTSRFPRERELLPGRTERIPPTPGACTSASPREEGRARSKRTTWTAPLLN